MKGFFFIPGFLNQVITITNPMVASVGSSLEIACGLYDLNREVYLNPIYLTLFSGTRTVRNSRVTSRTNDTHIIYTWVNLMLSDNGTPLSCGRAESRSEVVTIDIRRK